MVQHIQQRLKVHLEVQSEVQFEVQFEGCVCAWDGCLASGERQPSMVARQLCRMAGWAVAPRG